MIYETSKNSPENQEKMMFSQTQLVSVLFEYKLMTLGRCRSEEQIHKFFHDLLELTKNNTDEHLKLLF